MIKQFKMNAKEFHVFASFFFRRFKNYDNDLSGFLSKSEFIEGVMDSQVDMNQSELNELYDIFDQDDNGSINYEEFLACVRVRQLFLKGDLIYTQFW